jgi:phage tail protein X
MSRTNLVSRRMFLQWAGIASAGGFLAASTAAQLPESEAQATTKFSAAILKRLRPPSRTVYTVQLWEEDRVFTFEV